VSPFAKFETACLPLQNSVSPFAKFETAGGGACSARPSVSAQTAGSMTACLAFETGYFMANNSYYSLFQAKGIFYALFADSGLKKKKTSHEQN